MMADLNPEPVRNVSEDDPTPHRRTRPSPYPTHVGYDMDSATEYRVAVALERIADFLDKLEIPKWLLKK